VGWLVLQLQCFSHSGNGLAVPLQVPGGVLIYRVRYIADLKKDERGLPMLASEGPTKNRATQVKRKAHAHICKDICAGISTFHSLVLSFNLVDFQRREKYKSEMLFILNLNIFRLNKIYG